MPATEDYLRAAVAREDEIREALAWLRERAEHRRIIDLRDASHRRLLRVLVGNLAVDSADSRAILAALGPVADSPDRGEDPGS